MNNFNCIKMLQITIFAVLVVIQPIIVRTFNINLHITIIAVTSSYKWMTKFLFLRSLMILIPHHSGTTLKLGMLNRTTLLVANSTKMTVVPMVVVMSTRTFVVISTQTPLWLGRCRAR